MIMKSIVVFIIGALSFVYLINPTAGFIEFIPDNLPLFGNIDEAAATALLIGALGYFGIDISDIFSKKSDHSKK